MKREDDQQLWELLGRARQPELSPFFARNVIRTIRTRGKRFDWLRGWLTPRRLIPLTGLAAAVLATILTLHQAVPRHSRDNPPDVVAKIDPQDYDVVADLDELLAADESNLWDDDDTQTL
jgi:hypothetical protein